MKPPAKSKHQDARQRLQALREAVCAANRGIHRAGLVTEHSGNASGIDRTLGLVAIKPSGVDYESLTPEMLPITDLQGRRFAMPGMADAGLKPSVDLPHHLYLYRSMKDLGGVVHTHSNYATSFALLGRPIPAWLTAIADEFGESIPCAPYVDNQDEHIGEAILKHKNLAPAILLAQHGAFCWGASPRAALKAAIMLEDVARTCHLALLLGQPRPLPAEEVAKWHGRYYSTYGQASRPGST